MGPHRHCRLVTFGGGECIRPLHVAAGKQCTFHLCIHALGWGEHVSLKCAPSLVDMGQV